jgi:CheY-like chemotaxis protein
MDSNAWPNFALAQKMAALGALAGGVAHDFNNLLTVINGYSEMLEAQLQSHAAALPLLAEVRKAGQRGAALTQQLLAVNRKQPPQPRAVDLNALVQGTTGMLVRIIGESVELTTNLDPDLAPVHADPGQVEQVLMNLAVNARDATPHGGKLLITTANGVMDETAAVERGGVRPGRFARLTVGVIGRGMTDEVKAHLFEPMEVESAPGEGTRFTMFLPFSTDSVVVPEPFPSIEIRTRRGGETILLVEDDDSVRTMARRLLEAEGYQVLEAEDGPAAVQVCADHPGPVHLLVTDLVLPRAGGPALAQRLWALRPQMRALFLSGYPEVISWPHRNESEAAAFLPKPFTPAVLMQKVREALDGGLKE